MKGLPLFPIYLVDFFGSLIMLGLSLIAFYYTRCLKKKHPHSVVSIYLFWLSITFMALSISRSVGHVFKFLALYLGDPEFWDTLAPFTGGLNTMAFVAVAVLTFYFPNVREVISLVKQDAERIRKAKEDLEKAHAQLRDLTKSLEERTKELMISEQKFRRLFEGAKDVIFFCDEENRISDINQSGVNLLGYDIKEQVVGRRLEEFFSYEEDWEIFQNTLLDQGYIKDFEAMFITVEGMERYLIITAEAIFEQGKYKGCEGIAKDITTLKQITDQLIYSEKMASLGQLAAGVAHEINTPLGIILGYAQLLKEDFQKDQEVYEELSIIERQAKTCKRIVSDLLSFARSTKDQRRCEFSLNDCIRQTVALVCHTFEIDRIDLILHLEKDLPLIKANQEQISQVILNLLNNAHDAVGKRGSVHIWTRYNKKRKKIILEIGDTGKGIPPEIKTKIFDPFFTTKSVGKGTGLGLSVSYGIIRDHGGSIKVYSPPEKKEHKELNLSTVFEISLPLEG